MQLHFYNSHDTIKLNAQVFFHLATLLNVAVFIWENEKEIRKELVFCASLSNLPRILQLCTSIHALYLVNGETFCDFAYQAYRGGRFHYFNSLDTTPYLSLSNCRVCGLSLFLIQDTTCISCFHKISPLFCFFHIGSGVARGDGGKIPPPHRNGKNCCRKMMLFPKALFLATTFQKSLKIQFSDWIFIKNFQKFLKISQQFVFFSTPGPPTRLTPFCVPPRTKSMATPPIGIQMWKYIYWPVNMAFDRASIFSHFSIMAALMMRFSGAEMRFNLKITCSG